MVNIYQFLAKTSLFPKSIGPCQKWVWEPCNLYELKLIGLLVPMTKIFDNSYIVC